MRQRRTLRHLAPAIATLAMLLGLFAGFIGAPLAAADATPVVDMGPEVTGQAAETTVTFNVTTEDGGPVPTGTQISLYEYGGSGYDQDAIVNGGGVTFTGVPDGRYAWFVNTSAPYDGQFGSLVVSNGEAVTVGILLFADSLTIGKTVDNALPAPGADIIYTIGILAKVGWAGDIYVQDALPDGLGDYVTDVSCATTVATASCGVDSQDENGFVASISLAEPGIVGATLTVTVTAPMELGTAFTNEACAYVPVPARSSKVIYGWAGNPQSTTATRQQAEGTVCDSVDVAVTAPIDPPGIVKTISNASPLAGESIVYQVTVTGSAPAGTTIDVNDDYPVGILNPASSTQNAGDTTSTMVRSDATGATFRVTVGASGVYQFDLQITGTVDPATEPGTTITNESCAWLTDVESQQCGSVDLIVAIPPTEMPAPADTPVPTETPTPVPTQTPAASPTDTPVVTVTPTRTATAAPTSTETPAAVRVKTLPKTGATGSGGGTPILPYIAGALLLTLAAGVMTLRGRRTS